METLASGSIDLKSLKVAGAGASKYITEIGSDGIKVHEANNDSLNYIQITSNGMDIYKTNGVIGSEQPEMVASFRDNIQIGKTELAHIKITSGGLDIYNYISNSEILVGHLGYGKENSVDDTTSRSYYTFGSRAQHDTLQREYANSYVPGDRSVVFGINCIAEGELSQASGYESEAVGQNSYAGGLNSGAIGDYSYANGNHVQATADYQTVFGKYNEVDSEALFLIGNGTAINSRSNLMVVGNNSIRIGNIGQSHLLMDFHSLQMIDKETDSYIEFKDLRDTSGVATITQEWVSAAETSYSFDFPATDTNYIVKKNGNIFEPDARRRSGFILLEEPDVGDVFTAIYSTASQDAKKYTIGTRKSTSIDGGSSIAIGKEVSASGAYSYAEGYYTTASGYISHAEGINTIASGRYTHVQNMYTIASQLAQTALGRFNVEDSFFDKISIAGTYMPFGEYAFIIGNGTSDSARSNALAVDWEGNTRLAGDIFVNCNSDSTGGRSLTKATSSLVYNISNPDVKVYMHRMGSLVYLTMSILTSTSVASGSNIFTTGDIANINIPYPVGSSDSTMKTNNYPTGCGYYGGRAFMAMIYYDDTLNSGAGGYRLRVRNASSTAATISTALHISMLYMTDED